MVGEFFSGAAFETAQIQIKCNVKNQTRIEAKEDTHTHQILNPLNWTFLGALIRF